MPPSVSSSYGPHRTRPLDAGPAPSTVYGVTQPDTTAYKILVVEDDDNTRAAIVAALRWAGFLCTEAGDAQRAHHVIENYRPDLVVLDLGLPDSDGLELLTRLRKSDDLPVIVCSGRDGELDRVHGLDVGADDYVVKPFNPRELALRVRSILRRAAAQPHSTIALGFGDVQIDVDAREVTVAGLPIELTALEFNLLVFLARSPRKAFSRQDLLKHVWRAGAKDRTEATVTEHVRRLRRKIGDDIENPRHLCAVRGVGYRLVP